MKETRYKSSMIPGKTDERTLLLVGLVNQFRQKQYSNLLAKMKNLKAQVQVPEAHWVPLIHRAPTGRLVAGRAGRKKKKKRSDSGNDNNKTGVINDPLGRQGFLLDFEVLGRRTDNLCEYSDTGLDCGGSGGSKQSRQ